MLVDVHCHLDFPDLYKDLDNVIARAKKAGVVAAVSQGINHESNLRVLEIAKKYDIVKAALGLYPLDATNVSAKPEGEYDKRATKSDVDQTLEFIKQHKDEITAIGEVGLDFKLSDDKKEQLENFHKIIKLSEQVKKPLIIHSRGAELDMVDLLETAKTKNFVLHCFSGRKHLVKRAFDNGWFLSIPANIVRLQHFQTVVELSDMNQILTETDAPFLSPFKDKINEPAYVRETIKKISEIKKIPELEVEERIYENYKVVFG